MNLLLTDTEENMSVLDQNFELSDILTVFKIGYDHLSNKVAGKINRKLKRFIKNSKRSPTDIKILNLMYDAQKENEIIPAPTE